MSEICKNDYCLMQVLFVLVILEKVMLVVDKNE